MMKGLAFKKQDVVKDAVLSRGNVTGMTRAAEF